MQGDDEREGGKNWKRRNKKREKGKVIETLQRKKMNGMEKRKTMSFLRERRMQRVSIVFFLFVSSVCGHVVRVREMLSVSFELG
jgi:hypothetical protein